MNVIVVDIKLIDYLHNIMWYSDYGMLILPESNKTTDVTCYRYIDQPL